MINLADPATIDTEHTRDSGLRVTLTPARGEAIAVRLATLGPDDPAIGSFNAEGSVPG